MFFEKIKKHIDNASAVSFDVFDTLLLRPYLEPTDLFLHIEKSANIPYFCGARREAEKEARKANPESEDINIDDIYEQIDDVFKPLKQTELDWELRVLSQNQEMKHIWDYAKSKEKKIIIASDVYLSKDIVAKALKKNDFGNYDNLYVSSELKKTKNSGNMFKYILEDTGLKPAEILHIGDNRYADYKSPKKLGLNAVNYEQISKQFIKSSPRIKQFDKQTHGDLGASILLGMLALRWHGLNFNKINPDYWGNLGYEYAGPVIYGYTRWIMNQSIDMGLDTLLFVARDGYTLQKVFDSFKSNVKTQYVYAPRFFNLVCRLDYVRKNEKQSKAIIDFYCAQDKKIAKLANETVFNDWKSRDKFIQGNKNIFAKYASLEWENYKSYLSKLTNSSKAGMVDTITFEFSAQKLLQASMSSTLSGFYWGVLKSPYQSLYNYKSFSETDEEHKKTFTKNWNFMEFLITSPEYPIKRLNSDGTPVYDQLPSEQEKTRAIVYPYISVGALSFTKDINKTFGGVDIFLDAKNLVKWIDIFCDNPTKTDLIRMSEMFHSEDSDHGEYIPLFSDTKAWKKNDIKHLVWTTAWQRVLLAVYSPVKLRIRGAKYIGIHLLPKLKNKYFSLRISPIKKVCLEFILGNTETDKK